MADVAGVPTPYVVSELLEGDTLRERLTRGKLPVRVATELTMQVARGLAAAHEHGIVHRDVKPENVFVTKDGTAKVLDFGLAKLRDPGGPAADGDTTAEAHVGTSPGVVLGTVGYMAPEQVRAGAVDHRADLFAVGCVLYELLGGQRAFQGASGVETLHAILNSDPPDLTTLVPGLSGGLERIVRRCLEKDPLQRFQSARDLAFALEAVGETRSSSPEVAAPLAMRQRRPAWSERVAWALALSALAALAWGTLSPPIAPPASALIADVPLPPDVSFEGTLALSPDGTTVAFVGLRESEEMLWVRSLDGREARALEGSRGAAMPFWSPDGRALAYFANGKLRRVPAAGGPSVDVCEVVGQARGGTWSRSGAIVFAREGGRGLERVSSDGSGLGLVTQSGSEERHEFPQVLDDGVRLVFTVVRGPSASETHLAGLDGRAARLLVRDAGRAWATATDLVFLRGSTLLAAPLTADAVDGRRERVIVPDVDGRSRQPFAVAANGVLVYARRVANPDVTRLTWLDRAGKTLRVVGEAGVWSNVEPSPPGDRVVLTRVDPDRGAPELWLLDVRTDRFTLLSTEPGRAGRALWAPDGERVLYSFSPPDHVARSRLFVRRADGSSEPRVLVEREFDVYPDGWSSDDRYVVYASRNSAIGAGGADLWKRDLHQQGADAPVVQTKFDETQAHLSPDGRWLAYVSNEAGRLDVYVATFSGSAGRWQVSTEGGQTPRWRPDGRELNYLTLDGTMVSVPVDPANTTFAAGAPTRLFDVGLRGGIPRYAFTADGQQVLAAVPVADSRASTQIGVITNWTSLLAPN